MKYIQLDSSQKTTNKQIFAKGSILVYQAQEGDEHIVTPVKAIDEQGLPYPAYKNSYTIKGLKNADYHQVKPIKASYIDTSFPKDDVGDDPLVSLSLANIYEDKPYNINGDGLIHLKQSQKKIAEGENHLTDNQDEITTDFKSGVEGQNDPGLHPNYKADESEKPAPAPILGPLAKKISEIEKILKVKSNTEPNHQTPNNDNISTNFNTGVDGSATFDSSSYREDSGNKDWKDPFLGETSAYKN